MTRLDQSCDAGRHGFVGAAAPSLNYSDFVDYDSYFAFLCVCKES